jgi:O-antigen/teichoic acid export membrane protein
VTATDQPVVPTGSDAGPFDAGAPSDVTRNAVGAVARGGALNLVGAVIYGVANFALLVVLNRVLGAEAAGIVLVAIALFSIASTVAQIGSSTGLIRTISRLRAQDRGEDLPAVVWVGVWPVALASGALAVLFFALARPIADLLADGQRTEVVAQILRAMAPFLPFAALHGVLVQATRGFDTMKPQVFIERIGRASSLPLVVAIAVAVGMGPVGVGVAWAGTNAVAIVLSAIVLQRRVHRAVEATGRPATPASRSQTREFWAFTAPRAVGQSAEVAVNWLDTVIVGIIMGTTAAGIYASGTRYLLPGVYAAEALMQVTGPRISGLLTKGHTREASDLLKVVAGWQTTVMWPIYLLIAMFPVTLLRVFGPEVVQAKGALVALSVSMLIVAPVGPVASVILMSGRSRQAMFNTLVLVAVNAGGNMIFVPRYGLTAAGVVWGVTILVAAILPGWQAARSLHVATLGRPAFLAAGLALVTVGLAGLAIRLVMGDAASGLAVATSVGAASYLIGLRFLRAQLHLDALWNGIRRRS